MADLWEKMKKTVSEIYVNASEKAVDGVNLGVKKIDEVSLRRDLSREFANLGGRVYQILKADQADNLQEDATVKHHMKRLEELEERLEEKEREIDEIRRGAPEPTEEASSEPAPTGDFPSDTGETYSEER